MPLTSHIAAFGFFRAMYSLIMGPVIDFDSILGIFENLDVTREVGCGHIIQCPWFQGHSPDQYMVYWPLCVILQVFMTIQKSARPLSESFAEAQKWLEGKVWPYWGDTVQQACLVLWHHKAQTMLCFGFRLSISLAIKHCLPLCLPAIEGVAPQFHPNLTIKLVTMASVGLNWY